MSQLNDYLGDDRVCNEDFEEDNSERLDSDKEFEDELIRTVAEPILETLRSLNDAFDVNVSAQPSPFTLTFLKPMSLRKTLRSCVFPARFSVLLTFQKTF